MPDSAAIPAIARDTRTIAVVGLSPRMDRPSWGVARYLQGAGFRVIPVNPQHAGETILGETVHASLADIPDRDAVDMVDIFRRSEAVQEVVDEALAQLPNLRTVWMQMGVRHAGAAAAAQARGVRVVMDRCPKIEFPGVL